jgi:AmmeMemoRadiSam system protein A
MTTALSHQDKKDLLELARGSILAVIRGQDPPEIDLSDLSPALREQGACFVTLKLTGRLRGCVGSLEAEQPLALEVQEKAVCAAFKDFRFSPLREQEYPDLRIEISCLTPPEPLIYQKPAELVERLKPGQDGVILSDGARKATFLPQVWEKLPTPEEFLSRLCLKMGARADLWKRKTMLVKTYQVEKFSEDMD